MLARMPDRRTRATSGTSSTTTAVEVPRHRSRLWTSRQLPRSFNKQRRRWLNWWQGCRIECPRCQHKKWRSSHHIERKPSNEVWPMLPVVILKLNLAPRKGKQAAEGKAFKVDDSVGQQLVASKPILEQLARGCLRSNKLFQCVPHFYYSLRWLRCTRSSGVGDKIIGHGDWANTTHFV